MPSTEARPEVLAAAAGGGGVPELGASDVLLDDRSGEASAGEKSVLGLFADDAEAVDEAMAYVRERRKSWRIRPGT